MADCPGHFSYLPCSHGGNALVGFLTGDHHNQLHTEEKLVRQTSRLIIKMKQIKREI